MDTEFAQIDAFNPARKIKTAADNFPRRALVAFEELERHLLFALIRLGLGVLALRGVRWAYVAFVVLGLLYFPARVGFRLDPNPCRLTFDIPLAIHSLTNYGHIVLFALFFVMTCAQFRVLNRRTFGWSAAATVVMGALVEAAQGVTGEGNCRLRDLIPDSLGILIGFITVLLLQRIGWRPRPTWSLKWWRQDTRQGRAADRE